MKFTPPDNTDAKEWVEKFIDGVKNDPLHDESFEYITSAFSQAFAAGFAEAKRQQAAVDAQDARTHLAARIHRETTTANPCR